MINKINIVIIKITFFPQKEHIFLLVPSLKYQIILIIFIQAFTAVKSIVILIDKDIMWSFWYEKEMY